ncbi:PHP domain-containing protein [Foetidibacter luteolus]|uniref:PHP domain-containing protein n=1 Tax=Foetidibacter luteolus TaxID=2608880 RepID=UPI00129BEA36|nr:PHP domain-containing protein [Foetidibacter luteolus]
MYLNCKTNFSLRYGTFSTEQLVQAAVDAGATSLALTDINTTGNTWNFVKLCREKGIHPICGAEIRNGDKLCYILLAASNRGFTWINRFISDHLASGTTFPETSGDSPFFTDTWDGYVIYPLGAKSSLALHINEFIGVRPSQVNKLYNSSGLQRDKLVVLQPVTVQNKTYYGVHKLLRAIAHNVVYTKMPAGAICAEDEFFMASSQIIEAFRQYSFILTNTFRLMDNCRIEMNFDISKNKKNFTGSADGDIQLLRKLAEAGFRELYRNNRKAGGRLETELRIIHDMGFTGYFLMVWDLLRFADNQKYLHIGRGSGANSIVAYCLGISQVDPIEHNLFFERFLNPERTSPPDFDLDFSHNDVNDIFDYIFKRYGKDYVALMGTTTTFQFNAIMRELGKVFGLPKEEIDQLGEKGYYYKQARGENFIKRKGEDNYHELILKYGQLINNFPNIQSVHACGIIVTEEPVYAYTSCFMPPKGMLTTHMDMYQAESISLEKFDILSQMGLAHLKTALEIVKQNHDKVPDIDHFRQVKNNPQVKENMRSANTIGCFYIESPAMRQLLGKLHCDTYETLVVASSIIRPGVASSGMMREYILRHHDHGKASYLHPKMKALLEETYGIIDKIVKFCFGR